MYRVYSADLRIALKDIGGDVELVDNGQGFLKRRSKFSGAMLTCQGWVAAAQ